jgi:hypothetical protein
LPLIDEYFVQDLIKLTYKNPAPIVENILITLGNFLKDYKILILSNTNILIRLKEIFADQNFVDLKFKNNPEIKNPLEINIPIIVLWILNAIVEGEPVEFLNILIDFLPFLNSLLSKSVLLKINDEKQEEISQLLKLFQVISNNNEVAIKLIESRILEKLIELLQYLNYSSSKKTNIKYEDLIFLHNENLVFAMRIINNIYAMENIYHIRLTEFSDQIIEIFENIILRYRGFHKDHVQLIKEIVWTLSNIATSTKETVDVLCLSFIPQYLLNYFTKNDEVLEQVLIFFLNALESCSNVGTIAILKTNFLKTLCLSLKSFDKNQMLEVCMGSFKLIFLFLIKLDYENSYINSITDTRPSDRILLEIESHSIKSRLESLAINNNTQISNSAIKLLEFLDKVSFPDKMVD